MPTTLYNIELWRDYADHMRALSKEIAEPGIKRRMLDAAAGFERIADLAATLHTLGARRKRMRRVA